MKKITAIICVLLVLSLTVMLAACGQGSQSADGTYELTGMTVNGQDASDEIAALSEDGAPTIVISGNTATGSLGEETTNTMTIDYDAKTMTEGDKVYTFEITGKTMTITYSDSSVVMTFTKK